MTTAVIEPVTLSTNAAAPAHVVIATINPLRGSTGVQTHTATLCAGLNNAGVKCSIVNAFGGGPHWLALFAVRKVLDRVKPDKSVAWYRASHAAALRANLRTYIHSAHATPVTHLIAQDPVSARAAMDVRDALGLHYSVSMVCHFNYSEAREYRDLGQLDDPDAFEAMMTFEAEVLRSVDRVIYVSQWARDIVENDRHIVPRESVVIHNGISAAIEPSPLTRADIGASADDLVLMNVGTLEARKNQLGLLELFGLLSQARPQARLVLVGEGADRNKIEERAEELGLANRLTLLGHRTDVPALLPLADAYVHYASAENCPIVVLEAARAGLPWAAVAAAGVVELQREIGGCVRLDPDNVPVSARKLLEVIGDRVLAKHMGDIARANFKAHFTRDAMVNGYLVAIGVHA